MTTNKNKPVFFSSNLHDDLDRAFGDLDDISSTLTAIARNLEDYAGSVENTEIERYLRDVADQLIGQTDNLEKWVITHEDAVCEKLKDNKLVYERDTYQTLGRILQWDKADVRQLARWIRELKILTEKIGLTMPYLLHVRQIPTEPIPDDVSKYPVFVMDRQGYCLCGMELAEVKHLDEVRDLMS
ncbi:MAG TPA: hypothetical protein O0X40_05100 [Methanocorpusculum sp.]|nr:hypothetical protein [Methanocorpusculum sp.]